MGTSLAASEWEVDDAAPTWVRCEPPASDTELTRVWREEPPDDTEPELEATAVFPLERRLPPASALRVTPAVPAPAERSRLFATSVATFCVMAVLLALGLPWLSSQLP